MIPAPISPQPNQEFFSTSETGANSAEDQVFGTSEAEGENLFEDMLALLSLLGAPNEATATTPTDSVVAEEATLTAAGDMAAAPLNAAPTILAQETAPSDLSLPSGEGVAPNSDLVNEITMATSNLGDEYIPTVAESNPVEAATMEVPSSELQIATPSEPLVSDLVTEQLPNPQLAAATQQPKIAKATTTQVEAEESALEEELLSEVSLEEELPELKPAAKGESQTSQQQTDAKSMAELPIEADIVSAIEHRMSQSSSSQETNTPTNTVDTAAPSIAASTITQTITSSSSEITEPIKVPIAEQVATHLTSARIVRGTDKQEVTIKLDPPRLGTVSIEIVENRDGLTARVTAAEPVALQTLQSNLSSLLDSLEQAGIEFDKFEFGQELQQQDQQNQQRYDDEHTHPIRGPFGYTNETNTETENTPTTSNQSNQRLDITV